MKCFENFFKYTWRPQQVPHQLHQKGHQSRSEPTKPMEVQHAGETELGEVKVMVPTNSVATSMRTADIPCKNGGCKAWRSRSESRAESPWHSLKTIFLVSVIAAFLLWIIVYTLLDRYQIL